MSTKRNLCTLTFSYFFIFYFLFRSDSGISQEDAAEVSLHTPNEDKVDLSSYDEFKTHIGNKFKLFHHSFDSPISRDHSENGLFDWYFDEACIPTKKNVVLLPSIPNRQGQMWHRNPLETNNFQIFFSFNFLREDGTDTPPKGMALWYSSEPYTPESKEYELDGSRSDATLMGAKLNFNGIGVVFSTTDHNSKISPHVAVVSVDEGGTKNLTSNIPFDFLNVNEPVIFYITAGPNGFVGEARTHSTPWKQLFNVDYKVIASGYVGFTADSGKMDTSKSPNPIALYSMLTYNLDPSFIGEENPDLDDINKDPEMSDLLKKFSPFKDQREVVDSLRSLSRIVYQQISEQTSRESELLRTVRSLTLKTKYLENSINEIHKSLLNLFDKDSTVSIHHFMNQLNGMKALIDKQGQFHVSSIGSINNKLDQDGTSHEIKKLLESSKQLETTIHSRNSISFLLTIFLIFIVISFGFFMWKRFRDMEKKHYL